MQSVLLFYYLRMDEEQTKSLKAKENGANLKNVMSTVDTVFPLIMSCVPRLIFE